MSRARYVPWQDQGIWLGCFEDFPVRLTHGDTFEYLEDKLHDLHRDLTRGEIPSIRRVAELTVG